MKLIIIAFIAAAVLLGVVLPLGIVEEHRIAAVSAPYAGGELRVTFSPSFRQHSATAWPPVDVAGSPFDVGVMWVSTTEKSGTTLRVNAFRLVGQNGESQSLQPRWKTASVRNADGKFYTVVLYEAVPISGKLTGAVMDCVLETPGERTISETFRFNMGIVSERQFVNRIFERFRGL